MPMCEGCAVDYDFRLKMTMQLLFLQRQGVLPTVILIFTPIISNSCGEDWSAWNRQVSQTSICTSIWPGIFLSPLSRIKKKRKKEKNSFIAVSHKQNYTCSWTTIILICHLYPSWMIWMEMDTRNKIFFFLTLTEGLRRRLFTPL